MSGDDWSFESDSDVQVGEEEEEEMMDDDEEAEAEAGTLPQSHPNIHHERCHSVPAPSIRPEGTGTHGQGYGCQCWCSRGP